MRHLPGIVLLLSLFVFACGPKSYTRSDRAYARSSDIGYASYYSSEFNGRRTASGERYDRNALTAAHPSLPFDTLVKVINQNDGRSVVVRINDRGPFDGDRIIDVSRAAARRLGMLQTGVIPVRLEIVRRIK
jgi:rare lipoprotein A